MEISNTHWKWLIVEGIIFIVFGCFAIMLPQIATLGIEIIVGWLFLISGMFQLLRIFRSRGASGMAWTLLSGILSVVIGIILLANPMQGILTLTVVLSIFFVIEGITEIALGRKMKPLRGSGWLVFSGLLAIGMAVLIWIGWPGTAAWIIGLLVGINMLFFGVSATSLGLALRRT